MSHFSNIWRDSFVQDDMAEFIAPQFSKKQVVGAGKLLRSQLPYPTPEAIEAFRIAHNWRASHIVPMRHLRAELAAKVRRIDDSAIAAARLKRMVSIRAKLRRSPHTLYQMQDIAGCRAIMADQNAVNQIVELYHTDAKHKFISADDYISAPKRTGYRSHHLVFRYQGNGDFAALNSNPQFVEIQIRTRLQHAWATAVEAVGMVRGEDLKSNQGNEDWLRFFALMASEMASQEGGAIVPNTPEAESDRRKEIVALEVGLNALSNLDLYRKSVKISESIQIFSPFYLIQFDQIQKSVRVRGVSANESATSLDNAEGNSGLNSILVSVDKASDLKLAYPNYFMDVGVFTGILRKIVRAKERAPLIDPDWLRKWISRAR